MPRAWAPRTIRRKPVTIIVPFGPGSGTDVITRIVAQPLGIALKQTIVIENKPGANGAIAATAVARAMPDGAHAADEHKQPAFGERRPSQDAGLRSGEGLCTALAASAAIRSCWRSIATLQSRRSPS